jgi:hypothetical protein
MPDELGRWLVMMGLVIALVGVVLLFADRIPWLGRLPGDIRIERGNWRFYAPLGTSLLVSIILSLLLALFRR